MAEHESKTQRTRDEIDFALAEEAISTAIEIVDRYEYDDWVAVAEQAPSETISDVIVGFTAMLDMDTGSETPLGKWRAERVRLFLAAAVAVQKRCAN